MDPGNQTSIKAKLASTTCAMLVLSDAHYFVSSSLLVALCGAPWRPVALPDAPAAPKRSVVFPGALWRSLVLCGAPWRSPCRAPPIQLLW